MEGWHPVEDVVWRGFGQAQVVMANEAHSGLTGEEPPETLLTEDGA